MHVCFALKYYETRLSRLQSFRRSIRSKSPRQANASRATDQQEADATDKEADQSGRSKLPPPSRLCSPPPVFHTGTHRSITFVAVCVRSLITYIWNFVRILCRFSWNIVIIHKKNPSLYLHFNAIVNVSHNLYVSLTICKLTPIRCKVYPYRLHA